MTVTPPIPLALAPAATAMPPGHDAEALRAAGTKLEAAFLAEMLKAAGFAEPSKAMGGGAGEAHLAPMLTREVAEAIARTRPLGIGEAIAARLADPGE